MKRIDFDGLFFNGLSTLWGRNSNELFIDIYYLSELVVNLDREILWDEL